MREFGAYLRARRTVMGLFALFCGIFAVTFALYRLPLGAVGYPAGLCAAAGLCAMAADFRRERQTHRALARVTTAEEADVRQLPAPRSAAEADYRRIVQLLTQEQAAQRTRAAQRYDEMTEYYATWAHQIKTPIASMRLTLQGEDSPLSRRLQTELLRVEQYVEMVMMFLRLDSESTDYVIRPCDLDGVVRQAVKRFAGEFIERKIELRYEPLELTVLSDEKWLLFVIEQVLSNALKYTPEGSISISREGAAVLCIRDTGMGIAAEDLPRIFEKGYTGYHGRTDKRASGIGLYLCRRVCTNLGHKIAVSSGPDKGTCVRIDLGRAELEVE